MLPCFADIHNLETNLGLQEVFGFAFSVMFIGVAMLLIVYSSQLKLSLVSFCG